MFTVERRGVYGQGIIGVFSTIEGARAEAFAALGKEPDDYHEFEIRKFEPDTPSDGVVVQIIQPPRPPKNTPSPTWTDEDEDCFNEIVAAMANVATGDPRRFLADADVGRCKRK